MACNTPRSEVDVFSSSYFLPESIIDDLLTPSTSSISSTPLQDLTPPPSSASPSSFTSSISPASSLGLTSSFAPGSTTPGLSFAPGSSFTPGSTTSGSSFAPGSTSVTPADTSFIVANLAALAKISSQDQADFDKKPAFFDDNREDDLFATTRFVDAGIAAGGDTGSAILLGALGESRDFLSGTKDFTSGKRDFGHFAPGQFEYRRQMSAPPTMIAPETFPPMMDDYFGGRNGRYGAMTMTSSRSPLMMPVTPPPTMREDMMMVKYKFGQLGNHAGTFSSPHGFCLGSNEEIYIADTYNHRIQIFKLDGTFISQFGEAGKQPGQLQFPRKLACLKNGDLVVCDRGGERSRMQIFTQNGIFIRRIPIRYIDIVAGLVISDDGLIVAVDSVTPTIFFITEFGELKRYYDCSDFMSEPSDIQKFSNEYYICDFKGHKVVVIDDCGRLLRTIGNPTLTPYPNGIDISDHGDILVGDSHGNQFHVAVFDNDGGTLAQFTCPSVKVSRCCGLKITMNGFIVTLAKNNHHVLVLDKVYV